MSVEKIAAIKAKRLAKKRTTIKVDDDLEAGVLVWKKYPANWGGRGNHLTIKFNLYYTPISKKVALGIEAM